MQVLRSYQELADWAEGPVVISIGFFDGVHLGHRHLFNRLRTEAASHNAASLLITFSNSPRQYHDPDGNWQFLMTPEEKLYALSRCGIDAVLMLHYDESICRQQAAMFLKGLAHHVELKAAVFGYDTSIGSDMIRGEAALQELCRSVGIGCEVVQPFRLGNTAVKSSLIRNMVQEGRIAEAQELLGHPYFVMARIVRGRGIGQEKLLIPTANQVLPEEKLAPSEGIYAGSADFHGTYLPAAICIMNLARARSSVIDEGTATAYRGLNPETVIVESHILDYDGDLYGEVIRLDILRRIRDWQHFGTAQELADRMREDIRITREMSSASSNAWKELA